MKYDYHLHSYYSDGRISPTELVQEAKKVGLETIALTDHECVSGITEAVKAGEKLGVKVVPGIEFAVADLEGREQHLLGLFINYESKALTEFLKAGEAAKVRQIQAIIANLKKRGFSIEFEEVISQARGSINRAHIGYAVFENKKNAEILAQFDILTPSDFFNTLLAEDSSGTVFEAREKPGIKEVFGLIKEIGGISVWAHPFWKKQTSREIERKCFVFKQFGLGALEVCYNRLLSGLEKSLALHQIAQDLGLYETAGSDFHSFAMPKFNKLADFETYGLELRLPMEGAK